MQTLNPSAPGKQKARFAARAKRRGDEESGKKKKKAKQTKATVCFESEPWLEYPPLISSKSVWVLEGAAAPVLESSSLRASLTTSQESL